MMSVEAKSPIKKSKNMLVGKLLYSFFSIFINKIKKLKMVLFLDYFSSTFGMSASSIFLLP